MRHNPQQPNKQLYALRAELTEPVSYTDTIIVRKAYTRKDGVKVRAVKREVTKHKRPVIQYMPRGASSVKEGVRRFEVVSISHCYTHKQSGNVLMQCRVKDKDDNGKHKHRSLNVDLYTVES